MDELERFGVTLTVPEVAQLLGVSRNTAYRAVSEGQIPSVRFGRRIVVPRVALERRLKGIDPETSATSPEEAELDAAIRRHNMRRKLYQR